MKKECLTCGRMLDLDCFAIRRVGSADGHAKVCKECIKKYDSARRVGPPKICLKCGRLLPLTAYNIRRKSPDGRQKWCRECENTWKDECKKKKQNQNMGVGSGL